MKYDIIKTDNYLLVVDESEIKEGDLVLSKLYEIISFGKNFTESLYKKVIAHLPLNGSPILKGVDLLPPLEEDEVEKLAKKYTEETQSSRMKRVWKAGYNQAKEKYKYTEEDLRKAMKYASEITNNKMKYMEDYIQSLSQPKMPIGFERELVNIMGKGEPITERNSQGHTQWVGRYIYE